MRKICPQLKKVFEEIPPMKDGLILEIKNAKNQEDIASIKKTCQAIDDKISEARNLIYEIERVTPCSFEKAERILGKDYLGPETVSSVFDGNRLKEIPPIPFSVKDIEKAREFGQFLILRVDGFKPSLRHKAKFWEKRTMTARDLRGLLQSWIQTNDYIIDVEKEDFDKEKPRPGWALVDKKSIYWAGSAAVDTSYTVQLLLMLDYLKNGIYERRVLPEKYQKLLDGFKIILDEATRQNRPTLPNFQDMETLGIHWEIRPTFAEVLYDLYVYFRKNKEWVFKEAGGVATCSAKHSSGVAGGFAGAENAFIGVGFDDRIGLKFYLEGVYNPRPRVGAVLSRRF